MARPLAITGETGSIRSGSRVKHVRLGIWIELVTVVWMTIEASVAITIGFSTHSVSLQGFGIDSIIELVAGGILLWRLLVEQRGGTLDAVEQAERRASWITAIGLFALAIYIAGDSAFAFITTTRHGSLLVGCSAGVFRCYHHAAAVAGKAARGKAPRQRRPQSRCSVQRHLRLYVTYTPPRPAAQSPLRLVVGRSAAALVLIYFLVREGREALHVARTGETCQCGADDCC